MSCPPHFSPAGNSCLPTCPTEIYTNTEYTTVITIHTVFSALIILNSILVFPPYFAKSSLRIWPGTALMGIFSSVFILGILGLLPMLAYGKDNWTKLSCSSDTEIASLHDPLCGISAIVYYFCAKFAASLWMVITVWLLMKVSQIKLNENLTLLSQVTSFVYALIMPIIGTGIIIGKELVEGQTINGGSCFIKAGWYYDALWTIPLMIEFTVGTGALIASFVIVFRMGNVKSFLSSQNLLIPFALVYWYAVLTINILRFYIIHNNTYFTNSTGNWYVCTAVTWQTALMEGKTIEQADILAATLCGSPAIPRFGIVLWISLSVKIAATLFPMIFIDIKWWISLFQGKIQRESSSTSNNMN